VAGILLRQVLVAAPAGHEEKYRSLDIALDKLLEQALAAIIDPLHVLHKEKCRARGSGKQNNALQRANDLMAPFRRLQSPPIRIVEWQVQQRENCWERRD
jgi:hypothetical protein